MSHRMLVLIGVLAYQVGRGAAVSGFSDGLKDFVIRCTSELAPFIFVAAAQRKGPQRGNRRRAGRRFRRWRDGAAASETPDWGSPQGAQEEAGRGD